MLIFDGGVLLIIHAKRTACKRILRKLLSLLQGASGGGGSAVLDPRQVHQVQFSLIQAFFRSVREER
jgi:hypothetical protein